LIPIRIHPDWALIVGDLYRAYQSYSAILNAMAELGVNPGDHAFLSYLRSGKRKKVCWEYGAALMNLHAKVQFGLGEPY
jgi:hypothetical protein